MFLLPCLLLLCAVPAALAHDPGLSTATVRLVPGKLEATLTFALRDADELAGLDTNSDGVVSKEEFSASTDRLGKLVAAAFEVRLDDSLTHATGIRCQFDGSE